MYRRPCLLTLLVVLGSLAAPARAAVLPDLVVTSVGAPSSVVAGSALTVRTTVKNLQGRAGSSYVRVVLSKDKLVGSTDKVLGKRFVPALAAGATSTASKTWTVPATTAGGAWFLVACADATKLVREAREGNNCRARAITVTRPNRAPVAVADELDTTEEQQLEVGVAQLMANDSDPDADLLSVTAVGNPVNGEVSLLEGTVTFKPATDFHGSAGFSYTLNDGSISVLGTVTVVVTPENDPPVAVDDVAATAQDTALLIPFADLLANDTDVDNDLLNVTAVSDALNGFVALDVGQGAVSFTPAEGFFGAASFVYTVSDGLATDTGPVVVQVTPGPIEFLVEQTAPGVTEGGSTSVQVRLSRAPASAVTVTPSSPDGRISPTVSSLSFTPANWSTPQELVVHAEHDDDLADGVGVLWLESPDVVTEQLGWNIEDDDTQAIQTTTSAASLVEGGTTTVGVRLAFQPAGNVTVSVASGDTGAVTVGPASLVFTPSSWATPQTLTLTGVQDVDLAAESVTISLTSTGVTSASVTATVTDDDSLAVRSSGSSRSIREGTQSSVDITLSHQPPSNTTVTCSASPAGSVGVSPATMPFTPANYATPQTLVLTGSVDGDQEDDEAVVTCSATGALSATIAVTVVEIV